MPKSLKTLRHKLADALTYAKGEGKGSPEALQALEVVFSELHQIPPPNLQLLEYIRAVEELKYTSVSDDPEIWAVVVCFVHNYEALYLRHSYALEGQAADQDVPQKPGLRNFQPIDLEALTTAQANVIQKAHSEARARIRELETQAAQDAQERNVKGIFSALLLSLLFISTVVNVILLFKFVFNFI